jgi:hypothetical protein
MLPEVETWDAMPGEAALRPGVERLCGELGVAPAGLVRYVSRSRPVYAAGDLVLKLFPPLDGDAYRVEAAQIPGFLDSIPIRDTQQALLHTEIMREHLLVSQDGAGAWQLSGLIDFEPAMRGAPEYEFAALGVFAAAGDARFLRRALLAYGYSDSELDTGRRRLMGWTILHRYSHLSAYLARLPPPSTATFAAAADRWFATSAT